MGSDPNRRLAMRHSVPTTEIIWKVPRRSRGMLGKPKLVEAAVIDLSTVGAGIVCPNKWEARRGMKVEIFWRDLSGIVVVRRVDPLPGSKKLTRYGVEFATSSATTIGAALYAALVDSRGLVDEEGATPLGWDNRAKSR